MLHIKYKGVQKSRLPIFRGHVLQGTEVNDNIKKLTTAKRTFTANIKNLFTDDLHFLVGQKFSLKRSAEKILTLGGRAVNRNFNAIRLSFN